MANWAYQRRLFDFNKLSIVLLSPFPVDLTRGLVLQDSFLMTEPVSNLVSYSVGLGGETLVSENLNGVHTLSLSYLPSAEITLKLDILKKLKTQFGIFINNVSSPGYKGMASECRIIEKPKVHIGTIGFKDFSYKIVMTDYVEIFITSKW